MSTEPNFREYQGKYKGIWAWLLSVDHKRIGIMYMYTIGFFFLCGMTLGGLIKTEWIQSGETIMNARMYNSVFTLHGVIMVFLVVVPGLPAIFGNYFLPIMIGAKDVSFPRLNLLSYWLYLAGACIALSSLFMGDGPPDTGWTFYAPYSFKVASNMIPAVLGAFVLGFSSILTGINFVVTMHRLRAPGMTWFRMPLFCWSLYGTSWIQILATPVIGITLLMTVAEKVLGIGFFDPALGGDPVLYQHLFWIYSHPAVYIMILPAMGMISEILPTLSRKSIFGYKAIVVSTMLIAFIGYFVWAHHMFTAGMSETALFAFSFLTFLVAIPSAIKTFNWIATLYKASIQLTAAFYWCAGFIYVFMIGGFTGVVLGALATDIHLHDTVFVVAHFHYIVFGGAVYAFMAAIHYWMPKMFGRMVNEKVAKIGFFTIFVGFNFLYFPMFILGIQGMPRRYFDYIETFEGLNVVSSLGAYVMITGFIITITNLIRSANKGKIAPQNPWNGITLEWTIGTPLPTLFNFDKIPTVDHDPYDYRILEEKKDNE